MAPQRGAPRPWGRLRTVLKRIVVYIPTSNRKRVRSSTVDERQLQQEEVSLKSQESDTEQTNPSFSDSATSHAVNVNASLPQVGVECEQVVRGIALPDPWLTTHMESEESGDSSQRLNTELFSDPLEEFVGMITLPLPDGHRRSKVFVGFVHESDVNVEAGAELSFDSLIIAVDHAFTQEKKSLQKVKVLSTNGIEPEAIEVIGDVTGDTSDELSSYGFQSAPVHQSHFEVEGTAYVQDSVTAEGSEVAYMVKSLHSTLACATDLADAGDAGATVYESDCHADDLSASSLSIEKKSALQPLDSTAGHRTLEVDQQTAMKVAVKPTRVQTFTSSFANEQSSLEKCLENEVSANDRTSRSLENSKDALPLTRSMEMLRCRIPAGSANSDSSTNDSVRSCHNTKDLVSHIRFCQSSEIANARPVPVAPTQRISRLLSILSGVSDGNQSVGKRSDAESSVCSNESKSADTSSRDSVFGNVEDCQSVDSNNLFGETEPEWMSMFDERFAKCLP